MRIQPVPLKKINSREQKLLEGLRRTPGLSTALTAPDLGVPQYKTALPIHPNSTQELARMNRRPVHVFALGLVFSLLTSAAFAMGLEQKGQPENQLSTMPNYGMEVPSRAALKTIVPAGWQLFVHQSAKLPETLSWKLGDPWPRVLAELAQQNQMSVLLDWDARTVLIRTEDIAVQERATRLEIAQAAVTPLPKFEDAVTAKQAKKQDTKKQAALQKAEREKAAPATEKVEQSAAVGDSVAQEQRLPQKLASDEEQRQAELAQVALREASATRGLPVVRTNPTPRMVTAQQAAAAKNPAKMVSTAEFSYTQPVALNRPAARKVAQSIANKYNMRLVWASPEFNLRGPVTLLARSAEEDARLLQKAIGAYGPVVLEVSAAERVIRAMPRALAHTGQGASQVILAATAPTTAEPAGSVVVASSTASGVPNPVVTDVLQEILPPTLAAETAGLIQKANNAISTDKSSVPKIVLTLTEKEPLEDALVRFARAQGFTLEWKVEGGFEANRSMAFEGESMVQVLSQMLPPLGISADVYTRDKHIVVRPGEARDR